MLLLAFCAGAPESSARQLDLTPSRVHMVAEEASVVRSLLQIEDSLTYDAAALRPSRRALAHRVRVQNRVLITLCNAIIRDDREVSRAARELRQAHTGRAAVDSPALNEKITLATADAQSKLEAMKARGNAVSIADQFAMQMLMQKLSQLSEMSAAVVSAANTTIASMARNIKG